MKLRITILASLLVLFPIAILLLNHLSESRVSAQTESQSNEIPPQGGGEYEFLPMDEITDEERSRIKATLRESMARLEREGRLEPARAEAVPLAWPVAKAAGVNDFSIDAISNYVDQNLAFPNQIRDWNCGARTYDSANGYNHKGIDIFTWPFSWKKLDDSAVEVRAVAPGTIIFKSDGNFDRNCSLNGTQWNAVYIRHNDNSQAWYGHMKNGSLLSKGIGETVVAGEKLGIVGSSGNSTGPHLHFELYDSNGQLQDPYQGTCNTMNPSTWWETQEPYRNSRINALMTHSAVPVFNACGVTETTNEKTAFQPGEVVFTVAYYRDQVPGLQSQFSILRPDGSVFQQWTSTSTQTFTASTALWSWPLPINAPNGGWKLRSVYNGVTYETPFTVATPSVGVSGRVTTPGGQNLRNAVVTIIDANGVRRTATTSSFGLYNFDGVLAGGSYTVTVGSKRYRFTPRTLQISSNLTGIDFVGLE